MSGVRGAEGWRSSTSMRSARREGQAGAFVQHIPLSQCGGAQSLHEGLHAAISTKEDLDGEESSDEEIQDAGHEQGYG